MTLPPIDFSPLDPRDGPGHWDRLGARIVAAAEPELARRAALAAHPWERALLRHLRPVLAAAAALTLAAGGALYLQRERQDDPAAEALSALLGVSYASAATITREE